MKLFKLLLILLFTSITNAFSGYGTASFDFLNISPSGRTAAMGNSLCSSSYGSPALFSNPAGISKGIYNEAILSYNRWIEDVSVAHAGYRHKINRLSLAALITYMNSGQIDRRDAGREISGSDYSMTDIAADMGAAIKFSKDMACGISMKYVSESIDSEKLANILFGIGIQYRLHINDETIQTGISLVDLGAKAGYYTDFNMPSALKLGAGYELPYMPLLITSEYDYLLGESESRISAGLEYMAAPFLDLRCGYEYKPDKSSALEGFSAGFGLKYIDIVEYLFDYSLSCLGELGYVNRVSLGARF